MTEKENATAVNSTKLSRHIYGYAIAALIMLFNPNINIIDILPDFIGYFLLTRVLTEAAIVVPYMNEARTGFIRAMWVSILKIPAFFIMLTVRSGNTQDNDIVALLAFIFAVAELIVLIPAIKNLFSGLTYLGQRTNADVLISTASHISTDSLYSFTLLFIIAKSLFSATPELSRLTRTVEIGGGTAVATGSGLYPYFVIASVILGFIIGGVWLFRTIKYVKLIREQRAFSAGVLSMIDNSSVEEFKRRSGLIKKSRGHLIFIIASFTSFELIFSSYNDINLIPHFILGIFFLLGFISLSKFLGDGCEKLKRAAIISSAAFIGTASVSYVISCIFLVNFGYSELYKLANQKAHSLYLIYSGTAILEFIAFAFMAVLFFLFMKKYVCSALGGGLTSYGTPRNDKEYLGLINKKTLTLTIIMLISAITKLINILLHGKITAINSGGTDYSSIIFAPALPWFNIVVAAASVIYALYSIYYFNMLKEEMKIER